MTRCRQSRTVHTNCDACGKHPEVLHKVQDSRYCPACCPACAPTPELPGKVSRFIDPVLAKLAPATCLRSKMVTADCQACGRATVEVHMPAAHQGLYCRECCPTCSLAHR